jgi:hypothetical protein
MRWRARPRTLYRALDLRTRLIDRLRSLGAPSNVRENWEDIAQRIAEQDRNILASAKSLQEEIASQIAQTAKMGQASRAYGSADRSKSMLQGSLHG